MPSKVEACAVACARCKAESKAFLVRAEYLCTTCFDKYVGTKVIKRLEANKIRAPYNRPSTRILLPISFGTSSLVLLYILNEHNKKRAQQGRHEAYSLHLVHIDHSLVDAAEDHAHRIATLKDLLPACPLVSLPIQDCFKLGVDMDSDFDVSPTAVLEQPADESQRLIGMLSAARNASYRADVLNIVSRRLLDAYAERGHFDFVLYGDTSTRLAERALAEVAKGRGHAVPALNGDLQSGTVVPGAFPLRDLLRKEVQAYADMINSPLTVLSTGRNLLPSHASTKDHTIDDLMQDYISSIEDNFPSIVANVVRTTAKLKAPAATNGESICRSCKTPIDRSDWQEDAVSKRNGSHNVDGKDASSSRICHACQKMLDPS